MMTSFMPAGWRALAAVSLLSAAVPGAVGATAAPGAARAVVCSTRLAAVRASLSAERQAQLKGAADDGGPPMEFEPALRACFTDEVVPMLKAAEGDDEQIQPAFDAVTGWFREAQLLGFADDDFAEEWRLAYASLTTAFTNGYAKAKARCRTRADVDAAKKLRTLFAGSAIVPGGGEELFPTFQEDVAKCLRGLSYLITVEERTVAEKIGTTGELLYLAAVAPKPQDPDEMEGTGSYSGFVLSAPNCDGQTGKWHGAFHRLPLGGKLSASAQTVDMSMLEGPAAAFQLVLATLDWPYKPMFLDRRDAIATGEDREGVAGSGTFARLDLALTGPVTTHRSTDTSDGGFCAGTITTTTSIRIVQLGAR